MKKLMYALFALIMTVGVYGQALAGGDDDKKCVMMKDGKMWVKDKGKAPEAMTADVKMNDGTTVSTTGMLTKPDGTTRMLANGEKVDWDGNVKTKDKDKGDKDKKKDKM